MARTKKRIFDGLYAQLEETDGNVVLFSAKGEPSVIFEITNPVQQLCTDAEQYMLFQDVLSNVVQTLGEGYALQKQDVLCKQSYHHEVPEDAEFLTKATSVTLREENLRKYVPTLSSRRRHSAASSCSTTRRNGWTSIPRFPK